MAFNMKRKLTSKGLVSRNPIRQVHGGQIPIDPNAGEGSEEVMVGRKKQSDIDYKEGKKKADKTADQVQDIANLVPVAGEIIDAKNTIKDLLNKDYTGAALNAAGFFIPFIPGKIIKGGVNKVKDYIFKNVKGSKEAVKKSAKHMDHAGNYWKNPEDAAKINQSFTNTVLETPTQKLLGQTPPHGSWQKGNYEEMMKPVDLVNTTTLTPNSQPFEVPTNMTWFAPDANNRAFAASGKTHFEAVIIPRKPYVVAFNDTWGATEPSFKHGYKSIKQLMDEGYDAIKVVGESGKSHSETLVLDKSIIDIVKK
tara:strand:- start:295 stop:1221 length:927 start_codon:yes stop_codon:yes gene_type:complete